MRTNRYFGHDSSVLSMMWQPYGRCHSCQIYLRPLLQKRKAEVRNIRSAAQLAFTYLCPGEPLLRLKPRVLGLWVRHSLKYRERLGDCISHQ
jgi:hypothetical protein